MANDLNSTLMVCGRAEVLLPYMRPTNSDGDNEILKGFAVLPDGKTRSPIVLKVTPLERSSLCIDNEVISHHLAVQCGLQSPYTFPCTCSSSALRKNKSALQSRPNGTLVVLGVASYDLTYKRITQRLVSSEAVEQDILLWPHVAKVAVFDELMANADRHPSNLVRQGAADYKIIDHEQVIFGEPWFDVQDIQHYSLRNSRGNYLAHTIVHCADELLRQRLRYYAEILLRDVVLKVPAISDGLERLCHVPIGTTERLVAMLNVRRTHLPRLIQFYFEENSLFRSSTFS